VEAKTNLLTPALCVASRSLSVPVALMSDYSVGCLIVSLTSFRAARWTMTTMPFAAPNAMFLIPDVASDELHS